MENPPPQSRGAERWESRHSEHGDQRETGSCDGLTVAVGFTACQPGNNLRPRDLTGLVPFREPLRKCPQDGHQGYQIEQIVAEHRDQLAGRPTPDESVVPLGDLAAGNVGLPAADRSTASPASGDGSRGGRPSNGGGRRAADPGVPPAPPGNAVADRPLPQERKVVGLAVERHEKRMLPQQFQARLHHRRLLRVVPRQSWMKIGRPFSMRRAPVRKSGLPENPQVSRSRNSAAFEAPVAEAVCPVRSGLGEAPGASAGRPRQCPAPRRAAAVPPVPAPRGGDLDAGTSVSMGSAPSGSPRSWPGRGPLGRAAPARDVPESLRRRPFRASSPDHLTASPSAASSSSRAARLLGMG